MFFNVCFFSTVFTKHPFFLDNSRGFFRNLKAVSLSLSVVVGWLWADCGSAGLCCGIGGWVEHSVGSDGRAVGEVWRAARLVSGADHWTLAPSGGSGSQQHPVSVSLPQQCRHGLHFPTWERWVTHTQIFTAHKHRSCVTF